MYRKVEEGIVFIKFMLSFLRKSIPEIFSEIKNFCFFKRIVYASLYINTGIKLGYFTLQSFTNISDMFPLF